MSASKEERTEAPTQHKLNEAHKKGQVSRSTDLSAACTLLATVVTVHALMPKLMHQLVELMTAVWSQDALKAGVLQSWRAAVQPALAQMFGILAPILLITSLVALAVNLAQTGLVLSIQPLKPDFTRLNPVSGFTRMFSLQALVNLLKSVGKVGIIGIVLYLGLKGSVWKLAVLFGVSLPVAVNNVEQMIYKLVVKALVAMLILGAADFGYSKWSFYRNLRMSKQEVKEEFKQTEGNPFLKSALRSKQRALAKQRMAQEVPKADVVITNPTHYAIALRYEPSERSAPEVVAKGTDELAIKIRLLAAKHSVPILESPVLARKLYASTKVGDVVPEPLLELVAEIYAHVCETDQRLKAKLNLS